MKKLLILAFLISPIFLYSQELDEAYLESLPEDVREDVLKEMENQKKDQDPLLYKNRDP